MRMLAGSPQTRVLVLLLGVLITLAPLQSAWAQTFTAFPIGKIATPGTVTIGGAPAPTGTVVLSGELVATRESPALVTLREGGSVMLTHNTAATFSRIGNSLLIRADRGTLGFNFLPGEDVRIETPTHDFVVSDHKVANTGELEFDSAGHAALSVSSGHFSATELSGGGRNAVNQGAANPAQDVIRGTGILTKGRNTFTDDSLRWPDLKNKSITVGGETHKILDSTPHRLTLDGTWALSTGTYDYEIKDTEQEKKPIAVPVTGKKKGMSTGAKTALGLVIVGGAGGGVAAATMGKSKSGA